MNQDQSEITIKLTEYAQMNEDQTFLYALQAAGVDNWDGYDEAKDILEQWAEEDA